jgi:ABC-type transport system substrate-binding protein
VAARDEPFDIAFLVTPAVHYLDPYAYLNRFFDGRFIGSTNWAKFNSPKYNSLLRRAARLRGEARYRAYGRLDAQLARDAAPIVAQGYINKLTLVSKRVGCVILRPALDLTAVCLK